MAITPFRAKRSTSPADPGDGVVGIGSDFGADGDHTVQTRELHRYMRRRNAHARHPDVPAAQRGERARIRSEKGIRRGGRSLLTVA